MHGNTARNDDYALSWIKDEKSLDFACEQDLLGLYRRIFSEPPYNETFTDDGIYDDFQNTLRQNGLIFTATEKQGLDRVRGFVSSLPILCVPEIADTIGKIIDIEKTSYFSEDGVERSCRRKGISALMKTMLLQANWMSGMEHIVLRTSDRNYRQAAAVTKTGGKVISDLFQNVASLRQGGEIMQDRRAFYLFTPEQDADYDRLERVTIVRPGGNDTAIVWDDIPRHLQVALAARIQKTYPGVEQVMFVERDALNGSVKGQMAGGEFCGNATRSLGYLLQNGKDGVIDVAVSGAVKPMTVTIQGGQAMTEIPVRPGLDSIQMRPGDEAIVHLDGISHLVTRSHQPTGARLSAISDTEQRKAEVKNILTETGLIREPASGVMLVAERSDGRLLLDPYVYVRDTESLYYETGCGSGSTAVGLCVSARTGLSVTGLEIVQPSGLPLSVTVERTESSFTKAFVNGPIEIVYDSAMYLPRQIVERNPALNI